MCKKGLKLALNKRQMQVQMGFHDKINKYVNFLLIKEKLLITCVCVCVHACVIYFSSSLMKGHIGPFINIIFYTVHFSQYHSNGCVITNSPNYFLNLL